MRAEMKRSHRTFIVDGDEVTHLSQTKCNDFISDGKPVMAAFAGQTITLATAAYTLRNGKPWQIFHLETSWHRVAEDGSLDEEFLRDNPVRQPGAANEQHGPPAREGTGEWPCAERQDPL